MIINSLLAELERLIHLQIVPCKEMNKHLFNVWVYLYHMPERLYSAVLDHMLWAVLKVR